VPSEELPVNALRREPSHKPKREGGDEHGNWGHGQSGECQGIGKFPYLEQKKPVESPQ